MDQLDDIVKSAMQALEATTPRGYFDELPSRIEARLEGSSMQTESERNTSEAMRVPPVGDGILADGREEDSGVHDIKALARTAKQRVSRRITTQNDVVSDVLSASHSGLHAVALPDPAKMVSLPSVEEARAMARSTGADDLAIARSAAAVSTAHEPRTSKPGVPAWLWAGGGIAAAAAAVFAFVNFGGGKDAEPEAAQAERAPGEAAGSGAAAATPAPARAAARDEVAASGVVEPADTQALDGTGAGSAAAIGAEAEATGGAGKSPTLVPDDRAAGAGRGDSKDEGKGDEPFAKKTGGGDSKSDKGGGKADKVKTDKTDKADPIVEPKKKGDGSVLGAGDQDELGIGDALTGGGGKVDKPSKTELTSRELRDGLGAVVGKAKACYGAHGVAGTVKVKLTVDPGGKVSKASATGEFAGTPTGDCVASALKAASFPAWDGAPMSTTYAVLLSD